MPRLLKGAHVSAAIDDATREIVHVCEKSGCVPCLKTIRVGASPSDVAYESSLSRKAAELGIAFDAVILDQTAEQGVVSEAITDANSDPACSGIMLFRPMPSHLDELALCNEVAPEKDVDGVSATSLASVFVGNGEGFAPATARACIEICDHYGIELDGKHVVVVGRSLVIGKPVGMLALGRNATVTFCHSRSSELSNMTRSADIVIAAIGKPRFFDDGYLSPGQVVIDVGINVVDGRICGDVDADAVSGKVSDITPVPGGVGSVATSCLLGNVAIACSRSIPRF